MKKEFVVKSIDSAPDGAPYVVVSLSSIKDLKDTAQNPQSPFGTPKVMGFSNMNDMMKDLNKMMSGISDKLAIRFSKLILLSKIVYWSVTTIVSMISFITSRLISSSSTYK